MEERRNAQDRNMSGESFGRVSTRITQKLSSLQDTFYEQSIFKVNDSLRRHNKEAYEPEVVSIGPYHHGKYNLKAMETCKLKYLKHLLHRCGEKTADKYIIALTQLKDLALRYYAEEISLSEDDFLEMMCLDGCFVIEFLRKHDKLPEVDQDDPIFQNDWLFGNIVRDLILIENQVPFFILVELFNMTKSADGNKNFVDIALCLCRDFGFHGSTVSYTSISANEVFHLLDLVHKGWFSSFAAKLTQTDDSIVEFIKSTSDLQQRGVKFEMTSTQNVSWLDITFDNGKIKIPRLLIQDRTESVFRNLIAYEQYMGKIMGRKYVTDYTTFLDLLIDSPRDVEKLRHCNIIKNGLGDDLAVSTMFNKLNCDVYVDNVKFCYKQVFKEVNDYSSKPWNTWRAHLMRNYFSNPWSIISLVAATVLLILTVLQTIFSIKP